MIHIRQLCPLYTSLPSARTLCAALCLCLVLSAPAQAAQQRHSRAAAQALFTAQQHQEKGEMVKATTTLERYLEKHPNSPDPSVFLMLGNCYFEAKKPAASHAILAKGYALFPKDPALAQNYAVSLAGMGKHATASTVYENAYAVSSPRNPSLLYWAGAEAYADENFSRSMRLMTRLLASHTPHRRSWLELFAYVSIHQKQTALAQKYLQASLDAKADQPQLLQLLAQIHLLHSRYEKACAALEIAYALKAPRPTQWRQLARMYLQINAPQQALRCQLKAERAGNSETLSQKTAARRERHVILTAQQLAESGHSAQAITRLQKRFAISPSQAVLEAIARIQLQSMDFVGCRSTLATAEKQALSSPTLLLTAAYACWHQKDWKATRSLLQRYAQKVQHKTTAMHIIAYLNSILDEQKAATEAVQSIR